MLARLSVRIFMAVALLAGFTVGLSPNASAHLDTGSVAVVTGEVFWPAAPHAFFDLDGPITERTTDLNGCKLDATHPSHDPPARTVDGNSDSGLPVGTLGGPKGEEPELSVPPTEEELTELADWLASGEENLPRTYDNTDLCFRFADLEILSTGVVEDRHHATSFSCNASGTSGATGAGETPLPTFGAFYGEFVCDGAPMGIPEKGFVPSADGHFHGLTVATTTIAFLGAIQCTVPPFNPADPTNPNNCPRTGEGNDKSQGDPTKPVNVSNIKHTLACKGEVAPLPWESEKNPSFLDDQILLGNSLDSALVALECVIA